LRFSRFETLSLARSLDLDLDLDLALPFSLFFLKRAARAEIRRMNAQQHPAAYYRVVPAHKNWQIETAAWNLAGFLHCASGTRWQRFGHFLTGFLYDFLYENLNFLYESLNFL